MLTASLILNLVVLIPVLAGLFRNGSGMEEAFGPDTNARRILASIYIAISIVSLAGLVLLVMGLNVTQAILGLLVVQIIYKLITVLLVGLANVVVRWNLAIAVVHVVTVMTQV